jgi:hypothetical protein
MIYNVQKVCDSNFNTLPVTQQDLIVRCCYMKLASCHLDEDIICYDTSCISYKELANLITFHVCTIMGHLMSNPFPVFSVLP